MSRHLAPVFFLALTSSAIAFLASCSGDEISYALPSRPEVRHSQVKRVGPITALDNGRWIRCFRDHRDNIYLRGRLISRDGGRTFESQDHVDVEHINATPERATIATSDTFYATGGPAEFLEPGKYSIEAFRAGPDLDNLRAETSVVHVPDGPKRARRSGEWFGLYVYRTILELADGSWLMTMYGNFHDDQLLPPNSDAQAETTFMMRSFTVRSTDEGRTWHFLGTIASPTQGAPIGEGFVEPALTQLADGRLLAVMRTGHHYPLYASWSSDQGRTWSAPTYTGLDRACDPCLITLEDGRVALSWGLRYPEGWSRITPGGDKARFEYPGEGFTNLAMSPDGGHSWVNHRIAKSTGSCYSTIFEVAPNVLFFQVDQWVWRVSLHPYPSSPVTTSPSPVTPD